MPDKKTKTTVKKSAKNVIAVRTEPEAANVLSKKIISRKKMGILIGVVIIGVLVYVFRGYFVAAMVNGEPITRLSLIRELESQYGKQALEGFVEKAVILQEMKKKNISVSDAEVQVEIKKAKDSLKAQGLTLEDALKQRNMTLPTLIDKIKIQKMIEKLFSKDLQVSDQEISTYMEKNKDSFPPTEDPKKLRESIIAQLKQQKLSAKFQTWLSDLQKKAKIQYFVSF